VVNQAPNWDDAAWIFDGFLPQLLDAGELVAHGGRCLDWIELEQ
jgi:hypothetical protein